MPESGKGEASVYLGASARGDSDLVSEVFGSGRSRRSVGSGSFDLAFLVFKR